jgi:cell wall-associated NlpC family hydrolase
MVDAISWYIFAFVVAATPVVRSATADSSPADSTAVVAPVAFEGADKNSQAAELIAFAQTLKGVRYKYACSDPEKGFDCSGFVMYVFNHFQMTVPRSSIAFTNIGEEIELQQALPGDVILFTGTNASIRKVGHVGIITQGGDSPSFIHASSGKTYGVTETVLNPHYKKRLIKVIRLLK